MSRELNKAVVLAAGRGSRMREMSDVLLTVEQSAAADLGLKSLIPFDGHPFISFVLTSLADAGITNVCIVVGRGESPVRRAVEQLSMRRLTIQFAVQQEPRGSAHALMAAAGFAGTDDFVVINSDNDYPVDAFTALRSLSGPGLVAFARSGLLNAGIPSERLAAFALVDVDDEGYLSGIIEKPDEDAMRRAGQDVAISMTCWRFGPFIFDACRAVQPSIRGELEMTDAVRSSVERGQRFTVMPMDAPVLDLSRRDDIPVVARALQGRDVSL